MNPGALFENRQRLKFVGSKSAAGGKPSENVVRLTSLRGFPTRQDCPLANTFKLGFTPATGGDFWAYRSRTAPVSATPKNAV
jgi:hypothetical protein